MTTVRPAVRPHTRNRLLRAAFLLIIAGFVASNFAALIGLRGMQAKNRTLVDDTVARIELVSRIARDIDQKRLLVDAHIFEKQSHNMDAIEAKIARVDADFAGAARAYEQSATLANARAAWETLEREIDAIQAPLERVLGLSRENRDVEARAAMDLIESRFDDIARTADTLIKSNRDEASRAVAEMQARRQLGIFYLGGVTMVGAALALFVSEWVTRLLRRRDEQLAHAWSLLEQRNRELDAFAGRVAHDLRGPLTAVGLSISSLSERVPREEGAFAVLRRGVGRMEHLIKDLLALSRIDAQTPGTLTRTASVVAAVAEDLRSSIESADGVLNVDVEPAEVFCSEGLLRQVLWNLGENAVKYRRADVQLQITIEGRLIGLMYELRVSDNGSGMSPDEARQAFEPFFRGERAQLTPGTGLGLSIVKRIIESSGGTVSVDSRAGRGTTFVIHLLLPTGEPAQDSLH